MATGEGAQNEGPSGRIPRPRRQSARRRPSGQLPGLHSPDRWYHQQPVTSRLCSLSCKRCSTWFISSTAAELTKAAIGFISDYINNDWQTKLCEAYG